MIRGLMRAIERDYPRAERQPPRIEIDPSHELGTKVRVTIGFVPRSQTGEIPAFRLVSARPFRMWDATRLVVGPAVPLPSLPPVPSLPVTSLPVAQGGEAGAQRAAAGPRPRKLAPRSTARRTKAVTTGAHPSVALAP